MFQANILKNQESFSIPFLIFSKKKLPIWNDVKYTAEGKKSKLKI